jgi:transcriptional regulator of arginine metabolism
MDKLYRRTLILDLIAKEPIHTQADLCEKLARRSIHVTQATVSRDIEELGIVKTREGYRVSEATEAPSLPVQPTLPIVLKEFLRDVRQASNLVIIKTHPGNAHTVAVALDAEHWPEVAGTVAGDDTIFIAAAGKQEAGRLRRKILALAAA